MSDPIEDLYKNLKKLEPYFDKYLQSDPIAIGYLGVTGTHGEGILVPYGKPGDDGIPEITVNGRNVTIVIDDKRNDPIASGYDFSVEITEIRNGDQVIFSKENLWDHWWSQKVDSSGSTFSTYYDIQCGTLVSGVIHTSTIDYPADAAHNLPAQPARSLQDGKFTVRLVRDPQCMAMGAFTLPILPVGLLYAPPQPQNPPRSNTIKYTIEQGTAISMKFSLKDETSRTVPTYGLDNFNWRSLLTAVQSGTKAVSLMKDITKDEDAVEKGVKFSNIVDVVSSLVNLVLDLTDWQSSAGSSTGTGASFQSTSTQSPSRAIGSHGEEAVLGDLIAIIQNVHFAWVSDDLETVKLRPLGPAAYAAYWSIEDLLHDAAILANIQPPPPPAPPVPLVTITGVFPAGPDGESWITLGEPFTIHGNGFSASNAENQVIITPIINSVAQPEIAGTPVSSQPDKLEVIAPLPAMLGEGKHKMRVKVQNKGESDPISSYFDASSQASPTSPAPSWFPIKSTGVQVVSRPHTLEASTLENIRKWLGQLHIPLGGKPETKTGLDLECIQSLLRLDPLLEAGPNTDLSHNPRFQRVALAVEGGMTAWLLNNEYGFDDSFTAKLSKSTIAENTEFTSSSEQYKPSTLEELFGATGETLKHSTMVSTTHQDDTWLSRQIRVTLAPTHGQAIQCYYDTVFDSYILQLVPAPYVQTKGTATDDAGNSLPHQWILLNIGDQSVLARTDAQGHYAIYTPKVYHGLATLQIGKRVRPIKAIPGK